MQNPIIENDYEGAKKKAEALYKKIGKVWCPALGEMVSFDKAGFRHLIQKGRKFRMRSEQKRRFALLAHVEEILRDPNASFLHQKNTNNPNVDYWAFQANRGGESIRVVLRQIGKRNKHFLSIYGKKQKSAR